MKYQKKGPPISWPPELVSDIARRRCVLFLGAGVSCQALNKEGKSPKGWRDFLNAAMLLIDVDKDELKRQINHLVEKGDYLTACQVIKDNVNEGKFRELVKTEFLYPGFLPTRIHKMIGNLQVSIIATPNFDKVYEHHAAGVPVKCYNENGIAEAIRNSMGVILKIHGSIDNPEYMIFSRIEYARARNTYRKFYNILDALALTHTFLFIGCGLEDPDIRLVLEDYAFMDSYGKPHYYVLPKEQVHRDIHSSIEKSLNIKIITYDKCDGHRFLVDGLDDLVCRVSLVRADIARSQKW